jgi:hypothetical protein
MRWGREGWIKTCRCGEIDVPTFCVMRTNEYRIFSWKYLACWRWEQRKYLFRKHYRLIQIWKKYSARLKIA